MDAESLGPQVSAWPLHPRSDPPHGVNFVLRHLVCHETRSSCVALWDVPAHPRMHWEARAPEFRIHLLQPWHPLETPTQNLPPELQKTVCDLWPQTLPAQHKCRNEKLS